MTQAMIEDILRNHAEELRTIRQQIAAEQAQLAEDLAGLMDPWLVEQRQALAKATIEHLERRAARIQQMRQAIDRLPAVSRCTLLMLYYPVPRTYEQAAELLQIDPTTLWRRRRKAIKLLARDKKCR